MDNFHLDITSDAHLKEALTVGFKGAPGRSASVFRLDKGEHDRPRLILGWAESMKDATALPFPLRVEDDSAYNFVKAWLDDQALGREPDHDGDNGRGFRIYNGSWGRVDDDFYAFLAIEPAWAMYGK